MSIFGGMTSEGLEETQDRLGGFQPFDSDAYDTTIKLAYAGQSEGGARSVAFVFQTADGREYTEVEWITNKKGENFYLNQNDKTKKVPLPGFVVTNDICLATTEKPLSEQPTEDKIVNIYDWDQKKEVPKSVPVLVDLIGKPVTLGILRQLENKSEKGADGEYHPIADTRETNAIDKVFHTGTKLTMVEAKQGATEAKFYPAWVERNQGQVRDRRKLKEGAQGGTAGRPNAGPPAAGQSPAPRKSLFGGQS